MASTAQVFTKLNLKAPKQVVIINAPASFESSMSGLGKIEVVRDLKSVKAIEFVLAFATKQAEVDKLAKSIAAKAEGDAIVWIAYPKGTSKKYTCDFNRDTGWNALLEAGFDTVRQVAIDDDWSALCFRRLEYINR
jgi:hypothetical protein